MEAKGIRLQGELGISRQTIAQGMPECSDCTCMLVCAFPCIHCTRDRGCSVHPAFPAPSFLGRGQVHASLGRTSRCENANACQSSSPPCAQLRTVAGDPVSPATAVTESIGRSVLDTPPSRSMTFLRHCERSEAIHLSVREATMDCFAALAMTWKGRSAPNTPHTRDM